MKRDTYYWESHLVTAEWAQAIEGLHRRGWGRVETGHPGLWSTHGAGTMSAFVRNTFASKRSGPLGVFFLLFFRQDKSKVMSNRDKPVHSSANKRKKKC